MELETALKNFTVLKNLPQHTRLYVSSDGELSYDNRWLSFARRTLDGSSRSDVISPIGETFTVCLSEKQFPWTDYMECLDNLKNRFSVLYKDFEPMFVFLDQLEALINIYFRTHDPMTRYEVCEVMTKALEIDEFIEKFENGESVENFKFDNGESGESGESESTESLDSTEETRHNNSEVEESKESEESVSDMDDTWTDEDGTSDDESSESEIIEFSKPPVPRLNLPKDLRKSLGELPTYEITSCYEVSSWVETESTESLDSTEEETYMIPEIAYVNPLVHRPFENTGYVESCVNRFETQVK